MAGNVVREIDSFVTVRRALLSVSDKTGLETLVLGLIAQNPAIELYSTGGTHAFIAKLLGEKAGQNLIAVSDYTGQPETQGGLVKTLDFKIYLGLLTETYNAAHQADLARTLAVPLDLVVVNLYPFRETIAKEGVTVEEARANIDIGGPCMIRASAKNYLRVASVVDPADYPMLLNELKNNAGRLSVTTRFGFAQKAFAHTAGYDAAIAAYLGGRDPEQVAATYALHD